MLTVCQAPGQNSRHLFHCLLTRGSTYRRESSPWTLSCHRCCWIFSTTGHGKWGRHLIVVIRTFDAPWMSYSLIMAMEIWVRGHAGCKIRKKWNKALLGDVSFGVLSKFPLPYFLLQAQCDSWQTLVGRSGSLMFLITAINFDTKQISRTKTMNYQVSHTEELNPLINFNERCSTHH